MKQSSVEWLADRFDAIIELYPSERQLINDAIKQAKAMHREEIKKAWEEGFSFSSPYQSAEIYYNETFGKSEQ